MRDIPRVDFSVFTHNSNPGTFTSLHINVVITRKPFGRSSLSHYSDVLFSVFISFNRYQKSRYLLKEKGLKGI